MKKALLLGLIGLMSVMGVRAGVIDSVDVRLRIGYNFGGTSPLSLPASIRSIDAFRPTFSPCIGAEMTIPVVRGQWSVVGGIRLENKGMDAEVTVRGYRMAMVKGNSQISGLFWGHVSQEVSQWMLTVPVSFQLSISDFRFRLGPYVSLLVSKEFSGIASDGYLRQGDPTGPKIEIGNKEGEWATYDFSDDMRSLQWGVGIGVDWQMSSRLGLSADLHWGLSCVFQSDFKTVEQTLYPIYGSVGVFWRIEN